MLYIYHELYEEQILPYLKTWNITKSNNEACEQTDFKSLFFCNKESNMHNYLLSTHISWPEK